MTLVLIDSGIIVNHILTRIEYSDIIALSYTSLSFLIMIKQIWNSQDFWMNCIFVSKYKHYSGISVCWRRLKAVPAALGHYSYKLAVGAMRHGDTNVAMDIIDHITYNYPGDGLDNYSQDGCLCTPSYLGRFCSVQRYAGYRICREHEYSQQAKQIITLHLDGCLDGYAIRKNLLLRKVAHNVLVEYNSDIVSSLYKGFVQRFRDANPYDLGRQVSSQLSELFQWPAIKHQDVEYIHFHRYYAYLLWAPTNGFVIELKNMTVVGRATKYNELLLLDIGDIQRINELGLKIGVAVNGTNKYSVSIYKNSGDGKYCLINENYVVDDGYNVIGWTTNNTELYRPLTNNEKVYAKYIHLKC